MSLLQTRKCQKNVQPDEQDIPVVPELNQSAELETDIRAPLRPPQIFVFSATLTLPQVCVGQSAMFRFGTHRLRLVREQELRKRLRKGGGGAGGNTASLEGLMDKLPFKDGKPKIVDLTSERKVAEKVQEVDFLLICVTCHDCHW